jgi:uncharacterized protein (DUF1501 family)
MHNTRRDFLKAALGTSALASLGGSSSFARALRRERSREPVLVVVQLSGGNDGLNTIVPYGDDEYGRQRTTLRLPDRELHRIDSYLGFHPRMKALHRLFREGTLGIVQGVGHPGSSRNHAAAMKAWYTADPAHPGRRSGWIGRVADEVGGPSGLDVPALFVGPIGRPLALQPERALVPSIRTLDDLVGREEFGAVAEQDSGDNPLLEYVRGVAAGTADLRRALQEAGPTTDYPSIPLAGDLRTVAQLIRLDVGIRIFFCELGGDGFGGFDNHAGQLGNHGALLHQLSESVAAFVNDLERAKELDRVLLMTFSEFGRTLAENGRHGTGHGEAAPVLIAGGGLKGGLTGAHPSLTDLEQGAPKHHTDFRRLYATVLEDWLGMKSKIALGGRYEPLDILRS